MSGAYDLFGGGLMYSPGNGGATVIGVGAGVNAGKTNNIGTVGGGYTVDQGKTGITCQASHSRHRLRLVEAALLLQSDLRLSSVSLRTY
ncbi:hypothetical protein [Caballeronia sp. LZ001]|uniref:hypothetical protein n=1 Tax=Caballeronia sp. LZ001 TaxID=3038553 RepID=UPI0028651398|nr:hypothetical protein [Caballeronia sp. LZ001]MDR5802257.1 hypothetical protein [Caballeronia sp. LZ001]